MNTTESSELRSREDAEKLAQPQTAGPTHSGYRWRFRVAIGLFCVWLMYLAWVAWKVIVQ